MSYKKKSRWDKNRAIFFQLGLLISLLFCNLLFQIERERIEFQSWEPIQFEEILLTPERTIHQKKKLPKPKLPSRREVIAFEKEDEIAFEKEEPKIESATHEILSAGLNVQPELAPEIPSKDVEEDIPIRFADRMPLFGDCFKKEEAYDKQKQCSENSLLVYIYKHLKYPAIARENLIEGQVVIQFVVRKDGHTSDIKILRDIGGGCGMTVKEIIERMPQWMPAKQNGRPVSVYFTLPVKFKLEG